MIEILVNGENRSVQEPLTLADLLVQFKIHERLVVIERNGEIVPRADFGATDVGQGDTLEIVQMMAGG